MGCLGSRQRGRGFIYIQSKQQSISENPLDLIDSECIWMPVEGISMQEENNAGSEQ